MQPTRTVILLPKTNVDNSEDSVDVGKELHMVVPCWQPVRFARPRRQLQTSQILDTGCERVAIVIETGWTLHGLSFA